MANSEPASGHLRPPRLAEMVADTLRARIVDGEIADGEALPALDRLVEEFGVSAPSIREALRILENERLITVRRGNVGGAVVHHPEPASVAYTIGLVLQSDEVTSGDLRTALVRLQALCASLCAERGDRRRAVVPALRKACAGVADAIDDPVAVEHWSHRFHAELIERCGNESLVLVVGALERLWAAQREAWTYRVTHAEESPDLALRQEGLEAHVRITDAIEAGDTAEAHRLALDHMQHPDLYRTKGKGLPVRATDATALAALR